ncbi:MAG: hypothetical protein NPIRA04_11780 [Nitrospirales bacterium]|nr:MAG: hypothetical protein NPIRA04_11780 [Nitrospirales bacterium]
MPTLLYDMEDFQIMSSYLKQTHSLAYASVVRFIEEIGHCGLQASTIQLVDKPGVRVGKS